MLGGWGVLIAGLLSTALNCTLLFIAYRASVRAKTAEAWQSTAQAAQQAEAAAKSEMETHKAAAGRVEMEKMGLAEEVGRLKAATDLSRFSKENQEEHKMIVDAMQALQTTIREVKTALAEHTRAVLASQTHSASAFETLTEMMRLQYNAKSRGD